MNAEYFLKRGAVFFFFFFIVLSGVVDAGIGVSPFYYDVDFQPNLKQVFHFDFFSDDNYPLEIYKGGDLADYVELSQESIEGGSGRVNVLLELPEDIEIPGTHSIAIGAVQKPEDANGFALAAGIAASIRVKVPYPGKYATVELKANSAKAGEPAEFNVKISNFGKETITANTHIEIYDSLNKSAASIPFDDYIIDSAKSESFKGYMYTDPKQAGSYNARVIVEYGGKTPAIDNQQFRLGELYLSILNNTDTFTRNTINKFDIEVESFWNDPIDNVFANVLIPIYDIKFATPSVHFSSFGKTTLTGYFDSSSIGEDVDHFKAEIIVNYEGKTSQKIATLRFKKEINYTIYILIAVGIVMLILLIVLITWIRKIKKVKNIKNIKGVHEKRK